MYYFFEVHLNTVKSILLIIKFKIIVFYRPPCHFILFYIIFYCATATWLTLALIKDSQQ